MIPIEREREGAFSSDFHENLKLDYAREARYARSDADRNGGYDIENQIEQVREEYRIHMQLTR